MPNVGYLFRGYDLIKGNPMPSRSPFDPGFQQKIFKGTYGKDHQTDDRRYTIPDHVDILSKVACNIDFSTETITSLKEYQNDLSAHVSVSATGSLGIVKGSFSASSDYSKMKKQISSNSKIFIKSEATCLVYEALIQLYNPPKLTKNFANAVKRLAAGSMSCVRFLESFGTHYVKQVDFGSRYAKIQEISKSEKENLDKKGINVNIAASISVVKSFHAGTKLGMKMSKKNLESYSNAVERTTEISVGSKPPKDGKYTYLRLVIYAHDKHVYLVIMIDFP